MDAQKHFARKRQQRDALFETRVATLRCFMEQSTDGVVLSLLRFAVLHIESNHKKPRSFRKLDPQYQQTWVKKKNDETRATASRSNRTWTPEEDAVVLDAEKPDADIATALGRSLKAVECRRVVLKARAASA